MKKGEQGVKGGEGFNVTVSGSPPGFFAPSRPLTPSPD